MTGRKGYIGSDPRGRKPMRLRTLTLLAVLGTAALGFASTAEAQRRSGGSGRGGHQGGRASYSGGAHGVPRSYGARPYYGNHYAGSRSYYSKPYYYGGGYRYGYGSGYRPYYGGYYAPYYAYRPYYYSPYYYA